jgi:anti-sigma factor RsiW
MSNESVDLNCRQVTDLVTNYVEGALPKNERLAFEQHVAICPPCRAYFAQMRTVVRVAGSLREDDLPESVRESLVSAFRRWKEGDPER